MVDDACATIDVPLIRLVFLLKLLNHAVASPDIVAIVAIVAIIDAVDIVAIVAIVAIIDAIDTVDIVAIVAIIDAIEIVDIVDIILVFSINIDRISTGEHRLVYSLYVVTLVMESHLQYLKHTCLGQL